MFAHVLIVALVTSRVVVSQVCYSNSCGSPGNPSAPSWCNWAPGGTATVASPWCNEKAVNCEGSCSGTFYTATTSASTSPKPTAAPSVAAPVSPSTSCGDIISTDCQAEFNNANANNALPSFYDRCQTEPGASPLRDRCKLCCAPAPHPQHKRSSVQARVGNEPVDSSATHSSSGKCAIEPNPVYTQAKFSSALPGLKADFLALFPVDKYDASVDASALTGNKGNVESEWVRSNIFGAAIRWAFHDAGEFRMGADDTFGPDGCLSNSEANGGLKESTVIAQAVLMPIWNKYCDKLSRADFIALIGSWSAEMGDRTHSLYIPKYWGRKDNEHCNEGAGRLPGHQMGNEETKKTFVDNMKMGMHEAIALFGGHSVGHVHTEFSGFGYQDTEAERKANPLTNAWEESPGDFDNEYYKSMILEPWLNAQRGPDPTKNIWLVDEENHAKTIMLNADMGVGFFISTAYSSLSSTPIGDIGELCATDALVDGKYGCVKSDGTVTAGWPTNVYGHNTYAQCISYIDSNAKFLADFASAFSTMSSAGYLVDGGQLKLSDGTSYKGNNGQLGNIYSVDVDRFWA